MHTEKCQGRRKRTLRSTVAKKRNLGGFDRLLDFPLLPGGRGIFRIGGSNRPLGFFTTAFNPQ
jgi:hypothetical protein